MRLPLSDAVRAIAAAALAGPPERVGVVARIGAITGRVARWQEDVADALVSRFAASWSSVAAEAVAPAVADVRSFGVAWERDEIPSFVRVLQRAPAQSPPPPRLADRLTAPLPTLTTLGALADWLELRHDDLDWLADRWRLDGKTDAACLHHYAYHPHEKRDGRCRLIERPKSLLRSTQHKLLHGLLDRVPAHEAAHGFRQGRGIVSFAAPHAGQPLVLSFDLRDFFVSVTEGRVHALFRTLGYPAAVARAMTALTTNRVPLACLNAPPLRGRFDVDERRRLHARHLPQGAATSPALANLCAFRLDLRLSALAASRGAHYTRYADDLAFSGGTAFAHDVERFALNVAAIAFESGFAIHLRKTRRMSQGRRQRLAGVVINDRPNVAREHYDRIKAMLHNCVVHGPASQNHAAHADFRAHMTGRVAHVTMLNAARGAKLKALLDRIRW